MRQESLAINGNILISLTRPSDPSLPMAALALNPQSRHSFDPYAENGGTILAISGADFCIIAGDTRQSEGYDIQTRYAPRVFKLSVLQSLGFRQVVYDDGLQD
jgi:hypothetical protein